MKLYKDESRKNIYGKDLKFNKKFKVKTVLGIFFISIPFIINPINTSKDDLQNLENFKVNSEIYAINKYNNPTPKPKKEIPQEKLYLEFYCNDVYGLNYDKAYEIASNLTNNFTSEEYLNSLNPIYSINGMTYDSIEKGILLFTRHLYQKPQDFNVQYDEVVNSNFNGSSIIKTEELKVKYYSDLIGVDPVLALAIEYQESAKYSSDAYLYKNNPAGLMNPNNTKEILSFPSTDAGIIEHIYQLKKYYIDEGLTTPETIKEKYSPSNADNDPYDLNKYWTSGVNYFMNEINNSPNIFNPIKSYVEENENQLTK